MECIANLMQWQCGLLARDLRRAPLLRVPRAPRGTGWGLGVPTLAVLPLVLCAALPAALPAGEPAPRSAPDELAERRRLLARASAAEAALARSQERLHELRATLAGLRLSHQLLVDRRARLSRPARRRLERLHSAELARVERLLSTADASAETAVCLDDIVGPMVQTIALRGCDVRWRCTGSLAYARADDLTEILHILLDNAVQHAPGRAVVVETAVRGPWVELRVQDEGPGVPEALSAVVFDRGTRAVDSSGEGIGLHVARRLAQEARGDLWLEPSSPLGGAEFVLRIPATSGPAPCLPAGA
ncbi:sensor histidine kinase KdpD [Nocardioides sp. cx-173]|uniref:sensor histidine kinase n=1 Tax=Nocardioides sp. cx-173 TaxID=2898796 RepID=UPI001E48B920|nr:ATP-binding protein [Nocardioides sp. cx-173]MCD4526684.1 ATP-binding protein [Nocardioides sp. cx-173]UGB42573.1 ATP-binding protein [Nocardioides sp. cx-173]